MAHHFSTKGASGASCFLFPSFLLAGLWGITLFSACDDDPRPNDNNINNTNNINMNNANNLNNINNINNTNSTGDTCRIEGRLAAGGLINKQLPEMPGLLPPPISLSDVSVELLSAEDGLPDIWPVLQTVDASPDGSFVFDLLPPGRYSLRVNQPEFANVAYGVDSTEFTLEENQTVSLVLPLITTLIHGLTNPIVTMDHNPATPARLDTASGKIWLATGRAFMIVDPEAGRLDVLYSNSLFHGNPILAADAVEPVAWLLYSDRIMRLDLSIFSDPLADEVFDLDDPAVRASVGEALRFNLL
ncbi:carboxypeptidase-like regulatory domain-containing protein, partial [Myxococcota bacterium]|nr:carboxypeptidase-like regulatory domain-containing protein [Myxococcota bacterium]MBU1535115.1 carboxypeptidase-like regulatory domain-containing protein [Myxococcota bacterium]